MATYNGDENNNTYTGTVDPDYIYGYGGNDTLNGAGGDDTIDGGDGDDTLDGGAGNDALYAGAGKDTVSGGTGDDTIYLDVAGETLAGETYDGGDGVDTINVRASGVDLSVLSLISIERLTFEPQISVKITAAQADALSYYYGYILEITTVGTVDFTGATINGATAIKLLGVGANRLVLTGQLYNVNSWGAGGDDTILGAMAVDSVFGDGGNDALWGGDGNDVLDGYTGNDILNGEAGDDVLYGIDPLDDTTEDGDDTLDGGVGDDRLIGGSGNDTLYGGAGKDAISGGAGDDSISLNVSGEAVAGETYDGGTGTDTISVNASNIDLSTATLTSIERLVDNWGYVTISAAQADALNYIRGSQYLYIGTAGNVDLSDAVLEGSPQIWLTTGVNTFKLTGQAQGFDVHGAAGVDTILGGLGNDALYGRLGNDVLSGDAGNDTLFGGDGDNADGDGNDTLDGGDGDDSLHGEGGDDTITGGAGNDTLYGGGAKDTLSGGDGDDQIALMGTADLVAGERYNGGAGTDTINANQNSGDYDFSKLTLSGIERFDLFDYCTVRLTAAQLDPLSYMRVFGGEVILTTAGTIDLTGISLISGDTFQFTLAAGANRLTLTDAFNSNIRVQGNTGVDTITGTDLAQNYFYGGGGNDVLTGGADYDALRGEDGNDTLSGLAGDDNVNGEAGNDTIEGGAGNDVLTGGQGKDVVRGGDGDDTIMVSLADLVTGETFDGGAGIDTINANQNSGDYNFSKLTLSGIERFDLFDYCTVWLTAAQLDPISYLRVYGGEVILTTAGIIDLTGISLISGGIFQFTLAAGANRLTLTDAYNSNVRVQGNTGVDTIIGTDLYENYFYGGGGNDVLTGGARYDALRGEDGNDTLAGLAGDDNLNGGLGDDILDGGVGNDVLTGAEGIDTASYATATAAVTVSLALQGQQQNTGNAGNDTLSEIENLTGSRFADQLTGDANANVIDGGAGNDTLDGAAGKDAASYASATAGVTVSLAIKAAQATGGAGNDRLANFEGLTGSAFADTLTGDAKVNTLTGGAGNDVLRGGAGNDRLEGGDGVDVAVYSGSFTDYTIVATANGYTVTDLRGGTTSDGTDTLIGVETVRLNGQDFAIADAANVAPTAVADTAGPLREAGGHGPGVASTGGSVLANDLDPNLGVPGLGETLVVNGIQAGGTAGAFGAVSAGGTVIQGVYGTLTIKADGTYSYLLDNDRPATDALASGQTVQDVFGYRIVDAHGAASTATLSVAITGDNEVTAVAGSDKLLVTLGTATALSASVLLANDTGDPGEVLSITAVSNVAGGTVVIRNGVLVVTASAATGGFDYTLTTATGGTTTGHVTFDAVTTKPAGGEVSAAADVTAADLVGKAGADLFFGSAGDDRLVGNARNDLLDGRIGADQMTGGAGDDRYVVDNAADQVTELAGGGVDGVATTLASYTLGAQVENLTFTGTGRFTGTGNALANVISGADGADTLTGGDGDDVLIGGRGGDLLDGGAGVDTASYADAVRGVFVDLRITEAQATGTGADTLTGIENLTGSAFDDLLFGNDGANLLTGGRGADVLLGGRGADTFAYAALAESTAAQADRIADFSRAQGDRIDLSLIDPNASAAGDQAFTFIGAAAFTGAGGTAFELRVVGVDEDLFRVEGDFDHDGLADFAITVASVSPLQAADFVL